jgi:NAD-dependent DNA ligase
MELVRQSCSCGPQLPAELQILKLPKYKDKKVDNLLAAIEQSRKGSAELLLSAIGIPGVGNEMSRVLLKHFSTISVWIWSIFPRLIPSWAKACLLWG